MPSKIKVSIGCYNEIAEALQKAGQTINQQGSLTIEKDATIEQPYDFRLATIRRDCLMAVCRLPLADTEAIVNTANKAYQWVLKGNSND